MRQYNRYIPDEIAMCQFGAQLMQAMLGFQPTQAITLYLNGDLGAGKTTLSRGIIQSQGWQGKVKSPTYTLVEEYQFAERTIYHFDLYRLADPEELEFMGIRDYFSSNSICLIEWAEKGVGLLNAPDLLVNISYAESGRKLELIAQTPQGEQIISQLTTAL